MVFKDAKGERLRTGFYANPSNPSSFQKDSLGLVHQYNATKTATAFWNLQFEYIDSLTDPDRDYRLRRTPENCPPFVFIQEKQGKLEVSAPKLGYGLSQNELILDPENPAHIKMMELYFPAHKRSLEGEKESHESKEEIHRTIKDFISSKLETLSQSQA